MFNIFEKSINISRDDRIYGSYFKLKLSERMC